MNTEKLLTVVQNALEEKKAKDIKILDVHQFSSITDFMVVATGRTARQAIALAQYVIEKAKSYGHRPLGDEGRDLNPGIDQGIKFILNALFSEADGTNFDDPVSFEF